MSLNAPPLPEQFLLDGYRITSVEESTDTYHVYTAVSPEGDQVRLREFCPQNLAVRSEQTGAIKFHCQDPADLAQAKAVFDQSFASEGTELSTNGTSYLVISESKTPVIASAKRALAQPKAKIGASRGAKPALGARKAPIKLGKKKSSGIGVMPFVLLGLVAVIGIIGYQVLTQEPEEKPVAVAKKPTVIIQEKKHKPAPKPVEVVKEVEPEVVEEPEIVQEEPPEEEPEPIVEEEPEKTYEPTEDLQKLKKNVIAMVTKANGTMTKGTFEAYTKYAERFVREYVTSRGGQFSPAFEKWMKDTKHQKEIFATYYPPDPSVATNADILINAVGDKATKYDQLVIAFAIGRRMFGMGSYDMGREGKYHQRYYDLASASKGWASPADLFIAGKPPINVYSENPASVDLDVYEAVEKYLDSKKMTAKDAWVAQKQTVAALASKGVTEGNLHSMLREYMTRKGEVRRKRDAFPPPADFFLYLVDKYETVNKMRDVNGKSVQWDGVPLDCTPWMAMLPLSETRPIRECEYVWDMYLGKHPEMSAEFGGSRVVRYGHYRMDKDDKPPALYAMDPMPEWNNESYPSCLHVGGVCGTMSLLARDSQIAMGSPSPPAGQPGHGNLMTFHYNAGGCTITVDQSVDTVKVTTGPLYMRDTTTKRGGAGEYHYGIAASLNLPEERWLNGRLAMSIYKMMMEENEQSPLQENMIMQILKTNPFYTDAWYLLFDKRGENLPAAIATIDDIHKLIPEGSRTANLWQKPKSNSRLGKADGNFKDRLNDQAKEYTDVLIAALIEMSMDQPLPDYNKMQWNKTLDWMKKEAAKNRYPEPEQGRQIALAKVQGSKPIVQSVDNGYKEVLRFYKSNSKNKKQPKVTPEQLTLEINAAVMVLPKDESVPWLKKMIDECPPDLQWKPKDNSAKITEFYDCVTQHYMKLAGDSEKTRMMTLLDKQKDDFVNGLHKK